MKQASSQAEVLLAAITSGYRPFARLLLFALACVFEDEHSGIPDGRQPSLTELAHWTGMHRASVKRWLNWLEHAAPVGLHRDRPDPAAARRLHLRTRYTLLVPDELGAALARAGRSTGHGLGAAGAALGAAGAGAGRTVPNGLGAAGATSREDDDSSTRAWELPAVVAAAVDELGAAGYALARDEAAEVARRVLAGRAIRASPEAYLRATLRKSAALYVPGRRPRHPEFKAPAAAKPKPTREEIRAAMKRGTGGMDGIPERSGPEGETERDQANGAAVGQGPGTAPALGAAR